MSDDPGNDSLMKSLGLFGVVLGDIAGCSGVGIGLGYLAWKKLGAPEWVIGITAALGLCVAFYRLYRSQSLL